ncbi:MAG: ADOP family duplicated permease [Betaproteobacteria bacterium]
MIRRGRSALGDLDEDIRDHIDREIEENIARGMTPGDAAAAARRAFGNIMLTKEAARAVWIPIWWDERLQDVRFALRGLRRTPALTAAIVATLAIGVGATTAIFSMVNLLLLRPTPGVADPARLVSVERTGAQGIIDIFSYPDYLDLHDRAKDVDLAGFRRSALDVGAGRPQRVSGALVTGNYFAVLGVGAWLGRTLSAADEHAQVVDVSYACWKGLLGGDPDVVGRGIDVNGHAFTVVGVLAPGFDGTFPGQFDAVWLPISSQPIAMPRMSAGVLANRNSRWVEILGRLREGVSRAAASTRVAAIGEALARAYPGDHGAGRLTLRPGLGLASDDRAQMTGLLGMLGAAAGLLFVIACGNAANLLLSRAEDRRREMATRRALGASGTRLAVQLLTEGILLATAGGAAGLWLAPGAVAWLSTLSVSAYGIHPEAFGVDARVGLFALALSALVSIVFTVVPLRLAGRNGLADALRSGARGVAGSRGSLRASLVVLQVGLSVALVIGAGLSVRTMAKIRAVTPGYATSGIVTASYALDLHGYTPPRAAAFFAALAASLREQPDVTAASWATAVPPVAFGGRRSVFHVGEAPPQAELQRHEEELGIRADVTMVGPDFFRTMGMALARGRGFDARDREGAQAVAVVNRALAERLWPGENAVGRYLEAPPYSGAVPPPLQVVGVMSDTRHRSLLSDRAEPVLYMPFLQNPDTRATLVLQTTTTAAALTPRLREAAATIDPDVPAIAIDDMREYVAATLWEQRAAVDGFGLFAVCGLCLAAIGVYAAVAHRVAARTRELGIRIALGASARGLAALVVRDSARMAVLGIGAGVALSLAIGTWMRDMLFGVDPHDPLTFILAPAALLLISVAASAIPAWRAARANPIEALHQE